MPEDVRSRPDPPGPDTGRALEQEPVVAYVETDRYCDGCGYNMRTRPVRRDPVTHLLVCRCPECGRFHAAGDSSIAGNIWVRRLGTLLLCLWMVTLLGLLIGMGGAQIAVNLVQLDELTRYERITTTMPGSAPVAQVGGVTVQLPVTGRRWVRVVDEDNEYATAITWLTCAAAFALGFLSVAAATVLVFHWPRMAYLLPALLIPLAAGAIAWFAWRDDHPELLAWATPRIVTLFAFHLAGGLLAVLTGRPFARGLIRILLPPRLSQMFAFLWLVDGKPPPPVAGNAA